MLSAGLGLILPAGIKRATQALAKFMKVGPQRETKSKTGMNPCTGPSSRATVCPALGASVAGKMTQRTESPHAAPALRRAGSLAWSGMLRLARAGFSDGLWC